MQYFADRHRHLTCIPYSEENLHKMAEDLGIKRCWFHRKPVMHYDMPKRRALELLAHPKVLVVTRKILYKICKKAIQ